MSLVMRRQPGETWRNAVKRIAGKYGSTESASIYSMLKVARGVEPSTAAWGALYDWDCLTFELKAHP